MRELTMQELELVAGGNNGDSEDKWYHDAFDMLEDGLDAIGSLFGGWMGGYLDIFDPAIDAARDTGDLIDGRDEQIDQAIEDAVNGGGGGG